MGQTEAHPADGQRSNFQHLLGLTDFRPDKFTCSGSTFGVWMEGIPHIPSTQKASRVRPPQDRTTRRFTPSRSYFLTPPPDAGAEGAEGAEGATLVDRLLPAELFENPPDDPGLHDELDDELGELGAYPR